MVLVKIFALVFLVMVSRYYLANHFEIAHYQPFFATGIGGTLRGAAIIFFAFLGFDTVSMMSEEVKDPICTIPRALLLAFSISFALYIGIAIVEIGILDWHKLGSIASPIAELAASVSNNRIFFDLISFSALVATVLLC
jgi:APA family basic amino acid/polyamine antiporter